MKLEKVLALPLAWPSSLFKAAPADAPAVEAEFDAVIVGGGPAGLAAASGLARVRRKVLLVDSGEYRNDPTRHAHDILGFDGVTPAWLRFSARNQISHYKSVVLFNGTVRGITPLQEKKDDPSSFVVSVKLDHFDPIPVTTRKIVLATGMRDELPSTPGVADYFGKGIYWCPWCDGHEHADQKLGIMTSLKSAVDNVREILSLNKDIVLLVNGTNTQAQRDLATKAIPGWERYLELHRIEVENRQISEIKRLRDGDDPDADPSLPSHPADDLFEILFEDGDPMELNTIFAEFPAKQKSDVGKKAGVVLVNEKLNVTGRMETNVPGIYAVGDANSDGATNVPHAFFSGKRAAVNLHVALEKENTVAQIARLPKRGDSSQDLHSIWKRMNEPGDVTHAGEYRP